jgi:hypothetical protein
MRQGSPLQTSAGLRQLGKDYEKKAKKLESTCGKEQ